MTPLHLDRPISWSPRRWAPPAWDGLMTYLIRDGLAHVNGVPVRAYLFTDGQILFNAEDVLNAECAARRRADTPRVEKKVG